MTVKDLCYLTDLVKPTFVRLCIRVIYFTVSYLNLFIALIESEIYNQKKSYRIFYSAHFVLIFL